jgi:disulfide bond formation protein DsbB
MTQAAINIIALVIVSVMSLGSIYLSIGLNLAACPLCYYQRTFSFALLALLLSGLRVTGCRKITLSALALPLALGGLSVAAWHVGLELRGKMECPKGLSDFPDAPKESLLAFVLLVVAAGVRHHHQRITR